MLCCSLIYPDNNINKMYAISAVIIWQYDIIVLSCCCLAISFPLITTLYCSAACMLCPDASRDVQNTFTPKITFCVPLSPSAASREGEGLPVTLGGVTQMVRQMWGRSMWWELCWCEDGCRRCSLCADECLCVRTCVSQQLKCFKKWGECELLCIKFVRALVYPCTGLVASPSHPTILLLHSWPPHPSKLPLGLPPAHQLGRAGVLGAPPPVLPGSCCPQLRSRRRYWGRTKSLLLWLSGAFWGRMKRWKRESWKIFKWSQI